MYLTDEAIKTKAIVGNTLNNPFPKDPNVALKSKPVAIKLASSPKIKKTALSATTVNPLKDALSEKIIIVAKTIAKKDRYVIKILFS